MSEATSYSDTIERAITTGCEVDNFDFNAIKSVCFSEPEYDYTDAGDAELFVNLTNGKVVYVDEKKSFAIHKERWAIDTDGAVIRTSKLLIQRRKQELAFFKKLEKRLKSLSEDYNTKSLEDVVKDRIKSLKLHCKRVQTKTSIFAVRELFKAEQGITVPISSFDSKEHYIGVSNGIVDLRNGDFITNQPDYRMMKSMNQSFDSTKDCPQFKQFMHEIMLGDKDMISLIQRLVGQMILGLQNKDKFVIFIGVGLNGKSVLIDLLIHLLGDYAEQTNFDVFSDKHANKDYFKAELVSKRLVAMNESNRGDKLDGTAVKSSVRSGKIVARSPHGKPFSYQPMFTPVLCTNYLPFIEQDNAIWDRLLIIPFDYIVPDEKRDPNLKERLIKEEGAGILNWMIEGAQKYYQHGLALPESLQRKQLEYRLKSDRIAQFLSDSCSQSVSIKESLSLKATYNQVYEGYQIWCKMNNYQHLGSEAFKDELRKRGFKVGKGSGGSYMVSQMEIIEFQDMLSLKLHDTNHENLLVM